MKNRNEITSLWGDKDREFGEKERKKERQQDLITIFERGLLEKEKRKTSKRVLSEEECKINLSNKMGLRLA